MIHAINHPIKYPCMALYLHIYLNQGVFRIKLTKNRSPSSFCKLLHSLRTKQLCRCAPIHTEMEAVWPRKFLLQESSTPNQLLFQVQKLHGNHKVQHNGYDNVTLTKMCIMISPLFTIRISSAKCIWKEDTEANVWTLKGWELRAEKASQLWNSQLVPFS